MNVLPLYLAQVYIYIYIVVNNRAGSTIRVHVDLIGMGTLPVAITYLLQGAPCGCLNATLLWNECHVVNNMLLQVLPHDT